MAGKGLRGWQGTLWLARDSVGGKGLRGWQGTPWLARDSVGGKGLSGWVRAAVTQKMLGASPSQCEYSTTNVCLQQPASHMGHYAPTPIQSLIRGRRLLQRGRSNHRSLQQEKSKRSCGSWHRLHAAVNSDTSHLLCRNIRPNTNNISSNHMFCISKYEAASEKRKHRVTSTQ